MDFKTLATFAIFFCCIYCSPQLKRESPESLENFSEYSGPPLSPDRQNTVQKRNHFGATPSSFEDDSIESVKTSGSHNRPPYPPEDNYPVLHIRNQIPVNQQRPQQKPPQQYLQQVVKSKPRQPQQFKKQNLRKLVEEEDQLPDRLTELLPKSNFNCINRKTGYYADESLGCEVFHYCQENARHSWICPEGFTFHQVHLICMPPSKDNICKQSSRFHFVNDYLYKPVNLEEHQNRPNVTLRYHERYYPEEYHQYPADYDDDLPQRRQSARQQAQYQTQVVRRPQQPTSFTATIRPEPNIGQVFRSPEDVNIPLEHRRPPQYVPQRYIIQEN